MKHILISLAMLVMGTSAAWSAWTTTAVEINGLNYKFQNKEAMVTGGVKANFSDGKVVIPATVTYNGTTYNVTNIGQSAFANSWITEIVLPEGITTFGSYAFKNASNLKKVNIPASWNGNVAYDLFTSSGLTDVTFAEGVTKIIASMFYTCKKLTHITFPSTLQTIESSAFFGCGLTSITLPASLTTMQGWPFANCPLTSINVAPGNTAFSAQNNMLLSADGKTLYGLLPGIESFTVPANVESLGQNLFYQSPTLTSVTIPATVKEIGTASFRGCRALTSVTFEPRTDTLTLSYQSFSGCNLLPSIQLPEQVATIPGCCFEYCNRLTDFTVPEAVTEIAAGAFSNDTSLTAFVVPDNVTALWSAFYGDKNLATLTLGKSVATLGGNMLSGTAVTKIICRGTTPPVPMKNYRGEDLVPFTDAEKAKVTVDVPADALTAYQNSPVFGNFNKLNGDIALGVQEQSIIDNTPIEYFDLQGRAVAAPEHGLFIKKVGNKTTKVIL